MQAELVTMLQIQEWNSSNYAAKTKSQSSQFIKLAAI